MQYQRFTPKLFGETALATGDDPQIGQFGSALLGTYLGTTDPQVIQALPAWSSGFIGAVTPSDNFPPLPETTGVLKVFSYLINMLCQQGIAEWDLDTEYFANNFCNRNGVIFVSKVDHNQGHDPLTDINNDYWENYSQTTSMLIGEPVITLDFDNLPVNCVWLEGQTNNSITTYANLFDKWGYTYGGSGNYFTFPNFQNMTIWGGTTPGYMQAGLPNIKGRAGTTNGSSSTGCFYRSGSTGRNENTTGEPDPILYFDASLSLINGAINGIYRDDVTTVQPPAIKVRVYTRYQ